MGAVLAPRPRCVHAVQKRPHRRPSVCVCVCVCVWSWSALQFALQDLKVVTIWQVLHVHPLFVVYCIVCYKRESV